MTLKIQKHRFIKLSKNSNIQKVKIKIKNTLLNRDAKIKKKTKTQYDVFIECSQVEAIKIRCKN